MSVFDKIKSSGLNIHELRRQNVSHAEIANLVNDEIGGNVSKSSIIKYLKEVTEETPTHTEKSHHTPNLEDLSIIELIALSARNLAQRIYIQSVDSLEDSEYQINGQDVTILKNLVGLATTGGITESNLNKRIEDAFDTLNQNS